MGKFKYLKVNDLTAEGDKITRPLDDDYLTSNSPASPRSILNTSKEVLLNNKNTQDNNNFNLDEFHLRYNKNKNISNDWLIWFIGFFEGDGHISVNTSTNQLQLIITQKEMNILQEIKDILGMGNIKYFPPKTCNNKNGFYRLIIWDRNDVLTLFHLFNGNLVLKLKIKQLEHLSQILEKRGEKFIFINKSNKITLQDAWLSGFTDAEGCFNIRLKTPLNINFRYILDQNDEDALKHIQNLFKTGKIVLKSKSSNVEFKTPIKNTYRYTIAKNGDTPLVLNYFDMYPLKTFKLRDFIAWKTIYLIKEMGLNKSISGWTIINKIKTETHSKNK